MKALVVKQLGNPMKAQAGSPPLELDGKHAPPKLGSGQVRISVAAASINFADVLIAQGLYQVKPKLPFIPGSELSGTVTEVSPGVKSLKPGDKVLTIIDMGAFAQEAVSHESACVKLPDGGGVGTAAVQIAHTVGAKVVAVARGPEKAQALKGLGADHVIDTSTCGDKPLRQCIKAAAPKGVDVVVDLVGGQQFEESLKTVRWAAHILIIGFASGTIPKVPANIALVKNLTVHGVFWGSYMKQQPAVLQQSIAKPLEWLAQGKVSVPISHRFPLEQAAEGYRALMQRQAIGKVLLLPNAPSARL
ncbi:hypothetical protein WJX73_003729 [Symbiochloris irregularis]|uniref:Enoyl reductase (ER) domain-containing protein n=1 Tax=Symbiochloris irregularis TaxID=706552 RepID=A0AAW1NZH0_9CHLO